MAEETKQAGAPETDAAVETPAPEASPETAAEHAAAPAGEDSLLQSELRLAAEYDNFRKRTAKEKESIWADAKADTVTAFLSVYDNLERAVKQPCSDEAYAKGVEMTLKGLKDVMTKLGIEEIPALGETFDANLHNAVMHVEDENVAENTIVDVFQSGFRLGDKVIRFAMVKVAN